MDPEPLVRAVVAALHALESADDDRIDPDFAVATMEAMAAELVDLSPSDVAELTAVLGRIADAEPDPRVAAFHRSVPVALGLTPR